MDNTQASPGEDKLQDILHNFYQREEARQRRGNLIVGVLLAVGGLLSLIAMAFAVFK